MKIRSVGAELLHSDGQTFTTKLTAAFRNGPTNCVVQCACHV